MQSSSSSCVAAHTWSAIAVGAQPVSLLTIFMAAQSSHCMSAWVVLPLDTGVPQELLWKTGPSTNDACTTLEFLLWQCAYVLNKGAIHSLLLGTRHNFTADEKANKARCPSDSSQFSECIVIRQHPDWNINYCISARAKANTGSPQGCVVSPLQFSINGNPMEHVSGVKYLKMTILSDRTMENL